MPKAGDIFVTVKECEPHEGVNIPHRMCHVLIEPYENQEEGYGPGHWRCNFGVYADKTVLLPVNMNNGFIIFNPENREYIHIGNLDSFGKTGLRGDSKQRIDISAEIKKIKEEFGNGQ